jgi:hypothetical protein
MNVSTEDSSVPQKLALLSYKIKLNLKKSSVLTWHKMHKTYHQSTEQGRMTGMERYKKLEKTNWIDAIRISCAPEQIKKRKKNLLFVSK